MPHVDAKERAFISRLIMGIGWTVAILGGLLFLPAGTLRWWRAWVFLAVVVAGTVAMMFGVFRGREGLLNERFKPIVQKGQPLADKVLVLLFVATFYGQVALIPLDVFRLRLLGRPGAAVSSLGLALFAAGWWLISLSFKENAFAAPVVRHQAERQQRVVDSGVYGIVRHPMYAGLIPTLVGMALWLESYAAALVASAPVAVLVVRILVEERFLKRELEGYDAYLARVRYRLIPYLW